MGKQRRAREKYHLACMRAAAADKEKVTDDGKGSEPLKWNVKPEDNPFAGLDIDISTLNILDIEDDVKSVKSISKSIKSSVKTKGGKLMKKQDKLKLSHSLFIHKIEAVYKKMEDFHKKSNKSKKKVAISDIVMEEEVTPASKIELLLNKKPKKVNNVRIVSKKSKGIKKANQRTAAMLSDLHAFKKALSKCQSTGSPLDLITNIVEEKVFQAVF